MAYPMKPLYCRRCRNLLGETNGVRLTSKRKKRAFEIEGECEVTITCEECGTETECLLKGGLARPLPRECLDEIKG